MVEDDLKRLAARDGAIGIVIVVCKRPKYLHRTMLSVLQSRHDRERLPVVISQDSHDPAMTAMIQSSYVSTGIAYHMHHEHDPKAAEKAKKYGKQASFVGYVRIAQHFGFALGKMFDTFGFKQVIALEEDMEIAPDFFSYFETMLPLLRADKDLFCVSAWNDNGYANLVLDPLEISRTDFFPGLGWMMTNDVWGEVRDRWPDAFWDEFMRRPDVRKGRHCLRPDISRSYTFGSDGTSKGQFFKSHLSRIKLNDVMVDWTQQDLSRLKSAAAFDAYLTEQMTKARVVSSQDMEKLSGEGPVRLLYEESQYKPIAKKFGLMPDEKEGIRRMSYRGVIVFAWQGHRVYLHTRAWPANLS